MSFHHEKLTVYQRALEFAGWSQDLIDCLTEKTSTRDRLARAGDAIVTGKAILEEIVRMLFTMLDKLGCRIAEDPPLYEDKEEEVEED